MKQDILQKRNEDRYVARYETDVAAGGVSRRFTFIIRHIIDTRSLGTNYSR
jgi:hypothetical protein